MDLRAVKDRILVRRERAILQSPGGIYIPGETTARGRPVNPAEAARPNEGEVLAIGSKVVDVQVGDMIVWNGGAIKVPGSEELELVIEDQVITRRTPTLDESARSITEHDSRSPLAVA